MEDRKGLSDEDLMAAVARGDHGAFRILVERYQGKVHGIIYRYGGNPRIAEDLAQDVFLKIYKSAKSYEPRSKFSTWMYRIVANHCINYRRALKADPLEKATKEIGPAQEDVLPGTAADRDRPAPDTIFDDRQRSVLVRQAVDALPDRQKMAITLKRFEGLSYAEIAEAMGCSVKAVDSLIQRAMITLRELLQPLVEEGPHATEGFSAHPGING
jgi:RNA polymerase sigma-70 factor (ECF subfamily)